MTTALLILSALTVGAAAAATGYLTGRRHRPTAVLPSLAPGVPASAAAPAAIRAILQALPDACVLLDSEGRVVIRNEAAGALIGAIEGRPWAASFRSPNVLQAAARVVDGGSPEMIEVTIPVPVERTIEAHVASVDVGDGRSYALALLRDITTLTRVERMRADFIANASHELRTPLTSLSGFIETIRGPARDDPEATDRFLEIMQTQANRMRRLIDDLLSLSRIELNEHVPPSGKTDLVGLARDVVDAAQPQLARAGIKAIIAAEPDARPVLGERDELVQVVQNLLDNAIKYGADGGDIAIRIGPGMAGGVSMTACSVIDLGPGIAREHIPRLTERFYRVDAKASRERGGTGLGLAIVKHIANRHRGRLEVESEPGKGSRFTILLPVWPSSQS